jgi:hypothetical protein
MGNPEFLDSKTHTRMKTLARFSILLLLLVFATAFAQESGAHVQPAFTIADGVPVTKPEPVKEAGLAPAIRPVITAPPPHKFLDLKNSLAMGAFGAALAADSYSTQRGLAYPQIRELNPIARPFVSSHAGQVAYSGAAFGLFAGGMYLVHRSGHHRVERIAPWIAAGWEAALAGWNMHEVSLARAAQNSYH